MMSDTAKKYLSSLVFSRDAKKMCSLIPLGGIYWSDEISDFRALSRMPDEARGEIYRLFRIRYALWDGVELSAEDLKFLELVRVMVPTCPIFKRLIPTQEDLEAQQGTREEVRGIYEMMEGRSEFVEQEINKDGSMSTTWRLKRR